MHSLNSSFILGYHGCDAAVAEEVLNGSEFIPSTNEYDWLGHGIYFWEANPRRGYEFALERSKGNRGSRKVHTPAVIGAVVELGLCLDLTTSEGVSMIIAAHQAMVQMQYASGLGPLPVNSPDGLRRN